MSLEKSDITSEAQLGLSTALDLAVRNWKIVRSKKVRSLSQGNVWNQKNAEMLFVSNNFSAHTSCPFQFTKRLKEKAVLPEALTIS